MKIKDLHEADRPREKALYQGISCLSNTELIAVLLRGGTPERSAVELASDLLESAGGRLSELFNMSAGRMQRLPGIGPCKAVLVQAAFELGKRFLKESAPGPGRPLVSPRMVYDVMIPRMKGLDHEECHVLFVNVHNHLLGECLVSSGGLESTVFDVRRVVRLALEKNASGVFLVHNHPSGDPNPSNADISRTDAARKALNSVGISLIDHVVVSDSSFFSFADDKMRKI